METIKVCIRMRPLLPPYQEQVVWIVHQQKGIISSLSSSSDPQILDFSQMSINSLKQRQFRRRYTDIIGNQAFSFDYVFGPQNTSLQIYQKVISPIIQSTIQGFNGAALMYGQTTSGKTYTMLGTPDLPGLLPCSMRHIFHANQNNQMIIGVSYLQIYNQQVNDLLKPTSANLKVKQTKQTGVTIVGLSQFQVQSFDQVIMIMNYGQQKRTYRETSLHQHSSRSHTIFKVYIENLQSESTSTFGCLNLVDLAGSQRLNDFDQKATNVMGETGHINKSLFVLSLVINKLAEGKSQHIPYRDSKLTRILSQALGGNSRSAIVCAISPAAINFHQTLSTLRFAQRATKVQLVPELNSVIVQSEIVSQYKDEISRLRLELQKAQTAFFEIQQYNRNLSEQVQQFSRGNLEEKFSQIHNQLSIERAKRSSLEKELQDQRQLYTDIMVLGDSPIRGQPSHPESRFIESLVDQVNSDLGELAYRDNWKKLCKHTKEQYMKELIRLQDKFREFLSLGLKSLMTSDD